MGWEHRESKTQVVIIRLKREDCKLTKHDSLFSPWKGLKREVLQISQENYIFLRLLPVVLIGPLDWKDHSTGKEGADRYRVHNLPNSTSCSGIYELGIAVSKTILGREISKLDKDYIVPVYIGQADNVRNRIQQYGREGAHLERGKLNGVQYGGVYQGPRLFSDIFSRGYSVVFRWAPMKNKSDAEKAEAQLLDTFDYAWNKDSNGIRRPTEIHKKLDKISCRNTGFSNISTKLLIFRPKKMGIKIKACPTDSNLEKNNLFSRIFKIGRSRPREVSSRFDLNEGDSICGVALGHGSVCQKPRVEGRKRCNEHKGMKINGTNIKLKIEDSFRKNEVNEDLEGNILFSLCGVTLEDGIVCDRTPVKGRKRCADHKGLRITRLNKSTLHSDCDEVFKTHKCATLDSDFSSERVIINKIESCGVNLSDGNLCTNLPLRGRKRCEEHKGMRIRG